MKRALAKKVITGKIRVPNGEIYFESMGKGAPIILIHAGFSDRRDWKHQLDRFSERYNVIVYDQRGSGNSSVVTSAFSPGEDLKAVMEHLGVNQATLLGHSVGGAIALDFALQYPERVSSLILAASGLNGYAWSKEYLEAMHTVWSLLQPEEMTKNFLATPSYAVTMNEPTIRAEVEMITKESFEKILQWKTFDSKDVHWFFPESISHLKNIKAPAFIVYGDKDAPDIIHIAHLLSENLENKKVAEIKNAGHLLNYERSDEFNSLIMAFLIE